MVILNANLNSCSNLNFRQHISKQSNGYFRENMKCASEKVSNRKYCYSTSIAVDQVMEIERYYDAFPALGTPSTSHYNEKISLTGFSSELEHKVHSTDIGKNSQLPHSLLPRQDSDLKNGDDSIRKRHHIPQFSTKTGHFSSRKDSDYNYYFKRAPKHHNTKTRKRNGGNYKLQKPQDSAHSHLKIRSGGMKESKPWKYLREVKDHAHAMSNVAQETPATTDDKVQSNSVEFISDDILKCVLESPSSELDTIHHLWDAESAELNGDGSESRESSGVVSVWKFDGMDNFNECKTSTEDVSDCEAQSSTRSTFDIQSSDDQSSDFDMIEQRLASINFCESVPDICRDSKLMPLFRENPFSYMIQQTNFNYKCNVDEFSQPQLFTCKHCQETYEIVLESESASVEKNYSSNGVLGLIDSRLDFDWCKYHPPPWISTGLDGDNDATDHEKVGPKNGCDCEFCRSRIWQSTCKWCATPL